MRKTLKHLLLIFFYFSSTWSFAQDYLQVAFSSDEVVPSFVASESGIVINFNDPNLNSIFEKYEVTTFTKDYPAAAAYSDTIAVKLNRVYKIKITGNYADLFNEIERLSSTDIANFYLISSERFKFLYEPNDYLNCFAHCNGYPGHPFAYNHLNLINAKGAWDLTRGLNCIKIAILDLNFTYNADLANKIDGVSSTTIAPVGTYTSYPYAHGTEVAGMAAAETNNGIGISSLGYNVKLRYYPSHDYNQFMIAVADGCKVINCSWYDDITSTLTTPNANYQDIIDWVYSKGVTVVAGAGNNNSGNANDFFYPASYNNVISVTSIGSGRPVGSIVDNNWNDCHRWFINPSSPDYQSTHQHNSQVDLCAPGYYVETTGDYNYPSYTSGTSLAAPQVAAAAALLYSLNPNFTAAQIENFLKTSAVNIYPIHDNNLWAGKLGVGRLDAGAALELAKNNACMPRFTGIQVTTALLLGYNHMPLYFTTTTVPSSTVEWEFVVGNEKIYKTGNTVFLTTEEFTNFDACNQTFSVYVRQGDGCCYSAYYKATWQGWPYIQCVDPAPGERNSSLIQKNDISSVNHKNGKVKIYPTPTNNTLTVLLPSDKEKFTEYYIMSADGKTVKQGKLIGNTTVIDVSSLSKGFYLIRTINGTSKFIKN